MTKTMIPMRTAGCKTMYALLGLSICMLTTAAAAQSQTTVPVGNADPEAQYKSCPEGYYSGPRPGRVRYTKDEYIWVVTPEFAAAYCMPPEFVDKNLKGADAIAYKPVYAGYETCGFGGQKEVCSRAMSHGFEIYYKGSMKLPSVSDTKYSHSNPMMLSRSTGLLSNSQKNLDGFFHPKNNAARLSERPGLQTKFPSWGLVGVKGPKPMWPIVALYQIQYAEEIMPGYNYISLEGSTGHFSNARMQKLGLTEFVIVMDRAGDKRDDEEKNLRTDYGHVIHLPLALVDKVRLVDKAGRAAFDQLLDKALPAQRR